MSYSIEQNGNRKAYGLQHFILDSPLDVANLPNTDIIPGSTAFCISNSDSYMLNHKMNWVKINLGGSGGSGSGLPSYTASDDGKFLGIVDGSAIWTNSNINNNTDTEIFWIQVTRIEPVELDKNYNEIIAAMQNGKSAVINFYGRLIPFMDFVDDTLIFSSIMSIDNNRIHYISLSINSENIINPDEGNFSSAADPTFIVEMTRETESSYVSTTTYGEAYSAIQAGKTVVFKLADLGFANAISAVKMGEMVSFMYAASTENSSIQGMETDTISISMV